MTAMTTPNNAAALLPCPFCGGPASVIRASGNEVWNQSWHVGCAKCGVQMKEWGSNSWAQKKTEDEAAETKAIGRWNRRATLAQPDALTSQPSGEAPEWVELKRNEFGYFYQTSAPAVRMPTGRYFFHPTHPSADARGEACFRFRPAGEPHFSNWIDGNAPAYPPGVEVQRAYLRPSADAPGVAVDRFTQREIVQALTQHYKDTSGDDRHVPATLMAAETSMALLRIIERNRTAALAPKPEGGQ